MAAVILTGPRPQMGLGNLASLAASHAIQMDRVEMSATLELPALHRKTHPQPVKRRHRGVKKPPPQCGAPVLKDSGIYCR